MIYRGPGFLAVVWFGSFPRYPPPSPTSMLTEYTQSGNGNFLAYIPSFSLSAQSGESGGCTPSPFHSIYHHEKSCGVRFSWEGRYTLYFSSTPICTLLARMATHKKTEKERLFCCREKGGVGGGGRKEPNTEYVGEKGECISPLCWSVHHNFVHDGRCSGRGWVGMHPHLTSLDYFSTMMECTILQKVAVATLCTLWSRIKCTSVDPRTVTSFSLDMILSKKGSFAAETIWPT